MTEFLNLDDVKPSVKMTIQLNGKKHELVPPSVDDFIENMRVVEKLRVSTSVAETTELTLNVIKRAFPTLPGADLGKMSLPQLEQLTMLVRKANGEIVDENEAQAEGNEPKAS